MPSCMLSYVLLRIYLTSYTVKIAACASVTQDGQEWCQFSLIFYKQGQSDLSVKW